MKIHKLIYCRGCNQKPYRTHTKSGRHQVRCTTCKYTTKAYGKKGGATDAWNTAMRRFERQTYKYVETMGAVTLNA